MKDNDGKHNMLEGFERQVAGNDQSIDLTFPHWVMSGVAGDFAKLYSGYMEACPEFFYMAFLTCLGNVISGVATIDSEIEPQPRMYTLLLGDSGTTRKSTAISKTVDFFEKALPEGSFKVCWGVGSAEGLQAMFVGEEGEDLDHILLVFDEIKTFVQKTKIEGSVLLPMVTTIFEKNRYESNTKTHRITLSNAHLSILAASTIDTYQQTWSPAFTDIGFNNRLWIVPGSSTKRFSIPPTIPRDDIDKLRRRLGEILPSLDKPVKLSITYEALGAFDQWYKNRDDSVHQKRLDTYGHRLMVLLAINEGKAVIDEDIVKKVIALLDWQYAVRRIHDPINADNAIAKMEEKIRRALSTGPKTKRELQRSSHANRTGIWSFKTAIKNLKDAGEIYFDDLLQKFCLRPDALPDAQTTTVTTSTGSTVVVNMGPQGAAILEGKGIVSGDDPSLDSWPDWEPGGST